LDVERVIVRYAARDYFNVSAGKFHTAFGYWNNAYHHGAIIQPTINRPVFVRFEDHGGYLPVHQVGLQFSGTAIGKKNFTYNGGVTNGQEHGNNGGGFDYSTAAVSGSVSIEPIENLQFLASVYSSKVPAGTRTFQGIDISEDSRYTLLNGSASYLNPTAPVEFVAEYYRVSNQMTDTKTANAWFVYLGFPVNKKFVPYVLYNKVAFEVGEHYFFKNDIDEITVGARYSFSPRAIWKLEYTGSKSEVSNKSSLFQTQFAIGF
jgi:hypothetical protein